MNSFRCIAIVLAKKDRITDGEFSALSVCSYNKKAAFAAAFLI
jgi:hypothetical protein